MDPSVTTAIVSPCATALAAVVALIQNSTRFEDMGRRIDRLEKQLEIIQGDLKEFFRALAQLDKRVQPFEDKQ